MRCFGICLVLLAGAEYFADAQLISNSFSPSEFPWMSHSSSSSFPQSTSSSSSSSNAGSQNIFSSIAQTDNTGAAVPVPSSTTIAAVDSRRGQKFDERVSDFIAASVLRFANNFGQMLSQSAPFSKNEVFSPVSIMTALAQLMLGAKGKSYQELKTIFGIDYDLELKNNPSKMHREFGYMLKDIQRQDASEGSRKRKIVNWRNTNTRNSIRNSHGSSNKPIVHIVKVANGLFTQSSYSLNPDYKYVVESVYRSELASLDFQRNAHAARDYINDWVDKNTFSKIPVIVDDEIPSDTKVIIANALYFKGFWENTFFEAATVMDKFYPDGINQPPVQVKIMATGGDYPFYDAKEHNCRIIGLPYRGNLTTMYVIQPNKSSRTVLREFLNTLDEQKIEDMISKMTMKTAVIAFPKLHLTRGINLKNILSKIGIREIFNNGFSDLSLIGAGPQASPPRPTPVNAAPVPQTINAQSMNAQQFSPQQFSPQPLSPQQLSPQQFNPQPLSPQQFSPQPMISQPMKTQSTRTQLSPTTASYPRDRFNGPAAIWSRFGDFDETPPSPLNNPTEHKTDRRRALVRLEEQRNSGDYYKSDLFVDEIIHKVDIDVNEQGTEAAAATLTYLRRSGTDVLFRAETPFLILIRHDPTKLVLFYGIINEPQS